MKGSTQKPHDQDFEDFITVDYCSEFSYTDINNWTCIEDFNPETNLTFGDATGLEDAAGNEIKILPHQ